jgi:TonB family protein
MTITIRYLLSLWVLFVCMAAKSALARPAAVPEVRRFYAVGHTFWDNGPMWDYHIVEAKQDGSDTLVRDVLIISVQSPCGPSCTVKARIKHLHNTTPATLVGENNPCAVDQRELLRELRRNRRALKHTQLFTFADFVIVADCGGKETVLQLPLLPFPAGPHGPPRIERSYDLLRDVEKRVFGTDQVFNTSADMKIFDDLEGEKGGEDDERTGAALVPELRSGAYDRALWGDCKKAACAGQGLKGVLETYVPPDQRTEPAVSWVKPPSYKFVKVALPGYPPLARLARVQGDVELELQVDERTGLVVGVAAMSGHPLLLRTAHQAARDWQFQPEKQPEGVKKNKVVLRFDMKCNEGRHSTKNQ